MSTARTLTSVEEYLSADYMGVRYVWVIDPETRQIYVATPDEGLREIKDGILRTADPEFLVTLSELSA